MNRDNWGTPDDFYSVIDRIYGPQMDVCATKENAKCLRFIQPPDEHGDSDGCIGVDAFKVDWGRWREVVWCNPPYSKLGPWLARARQQAESLRITTIFLSHVSTGSKWFAEHAPYAADLLLCNPRINFDPPPGVTVNNGNDRDSMLWLITPYSARVPREPHARLWRWKETPCE